MLLVHRLEQHRPDLARAGYRPVLGGARTSGEGDYCESFVPESLILPQGIPALCDDPGLRTTILATLSTFDESGVAVRQTGGRDPHRGIRISNVPAGGPQPAGVAPSAPAEAPTPWTRAKGLQAVPPPQVAPGFRRKRGDAGCAVPTGHLFWTPPEASEKCWWGRGGRLLGLGRAEARQSSANTTIGSAATTTNTTVGSAAPPPPGGNLPQGHKQ
jgi:hypothetical protein